jgi:hypothetical protein
MVLDLPSWFRREPRARRILKSYCERLTGIARSAQAGLGHLLFTRPVEIDPCVAGDSGPLGQADGGSANIEMETRHESKSGRAFFRANADVGGDP